MKHQIILTWETGVEVIDIDFASNNEITEIHNEITETYEKLRDSDFLARYKTTSKRTIINGCHQIEITYNGKFDEKSQLPEEIMNKGFSAGFTRLIVSEDLKKIKLAEYHSQDISTAGHARRKKINPIESVQRKREEESVVRQVRDQQFRNQLLKIYKGKPHCEITKEDLSEALDAAHIYEVRQDGDDNADSNGIFLRADIHRLFDSRAFKILQDGTINFKPKNLTKSYEKILKEAKICGPTLDRIKDSLQKRNEHDNQKDL